MLTYLSIQMKERQVQHTRLLTVFITNHFFVPDKRKKTKNVWKQQTAVLDVYDCKNKKLKFFFTVTKKITR